MQFLSFNEKKIFGEYFTSEDGLFLDMNSQEFVDFFAQFGVEIKNTPKYGGMGSSEKQRFCRFLEVESRNLIKKVLQEAHQYKKHFVEGRRGLVNPTELFLKGIDPLIDTKITDLINRLSGERKEIQIEDELEFVKESAKNTVENSIKSSMRLAKRGLKKKKEELSPPKILNHMIVKDQRKLLEKHSEDLGFYVPGSKGSDDHLEKWSREVFKED